MSYCRTSEPNCDVYVWGGLYALELSIANSALDKLGWTREEGYKTFYYEQPNAGQKMFDYLIHLDALGVRVPSDALERLQSEIDDGLFDCIPPWGTNLPDKHLHFLENTS